MKTECRFMAQFENNKSRKVAPHNRNDSRFFPSSQYDNVNREEKVNCYYEH